MLDAGLLKRFLELYPFQPATAVWRTAEVAEVAAAGLGLTSGVGLDLGCGDGRLTRVLAEQVGGLRVIGVDLDPLETALAAEEQEYMRLHTCSAENIPEPDSSLDFVLSISVLEHIPCIEAVLAEIGRLLKPGGRALLTVPSVGFRRCLRGPLIPGQSRKKYCRSLDRRLAHLRYWPAGRWNRELDNVGLSLVRAVPILSAGEVRRWETLSRITAGVLHVVAGRRAPIQIQRSLGLRRGHRLPAPLAALLSHLLSVGVDTTPPRTEFVSGCLLLIATRRHDAS